MDRREQTAEADKVVSVVDIVRIPVVFWTGAAKPVLDANFLVLLSGPAQFLIDVADGYERAVGWCNTLPSSPFTAEQCRGAEQVERRALRLL